MHIFEGRFEVRRGVAGTTQAAECQAAFGHSNPKRGTSDRIEYRLCGAVVRHVALVGIPTVKAAKTE
jgi:hypothetical protein